MHNVVNELESVPVVIGVGVALPSVDPTSRWTVELTLWTDGIPAVVNSILGEYGLMLRHARRRGDMA